MNLYIEQNTGTFLNETVNWIGILTADYQQHTILYHSNFVKPYIVVKEGFISNINTINIINSHENVDIIYNDLVVISKRTSSDPVTVFHNTDVYNLILPNDYTAAYKIICKWDSDKDDIVYLTNTESFSDIQSNDITKLNIAGLASGSMIAEFAYTYQSKKIVFFDYSKSSLDFQKDMIYSPNRSLVLEKYFNKFITGQVPATIEDILNLDIDHLNEIYNYVRLQSVEFIYCDLRNINNINTLFNALDSTFTLWLSNALYYVTSINKNKQACIDLIYQLSKDKDINILPFMTINYES